MKKISYDEMWHNLHQYNVDHPDREDYGDISAVIVYKSENWDKPYSLESRSYRVYNNNRAFQPNKIANSLYGSALDGSDNGVRLDWYKWSVDYCYMD